MWDYNKANTFVYVIKGDNMDYYYNDKPHDMSEGDFFGTLDKVNAIYEILTGNENAIVKNVDMMALYGSWGSGKTTVMKEVEKKLIESNHRYHVIFFESWKYENDSDLALSLLEAMLDQCKEEVVNNVLKDNLKKVGRSLFNFSKNLLYSTELSFLGILTLKPGDAVKNALTETKETYQNTSYYKAVQNFEKSFEEVINTYMNAQNSPILIMIDDLDRCEPENVIRLLAAIKHFFMHDKIVYFCGIDKVAVESAIKIKYGTYISSEDYLDKLFPISFTMPEIRVEEFIGDFVNKVYEGNEGSEIATKLITELLVKIKFLNPRQIKKAFNKYLSFKILSKINNDKYSLQSIVDLSDPHYLVYSLFFIILKEFYGSEFNDLLNYREKLMKLANKIPCDNIVGGINLDNRTEKPEMFLQGAIISFERISINASLNNLERNLSLIVYIFYWLTPSEFTDLAYRNFTSLESIYEYINYIKTRNNPNNILCYFSEFLYSQLHNIDSNFVYPIYKSIKTINDFS